MNNRFTKVANSTAVRDNKSGAVLFKSNERYLIAKNRKMVARQMKERDADYLNLKSKNKSLELRLQKIEKLIREK